MSTAWSPIRSKQRETMIIRRPHSWSVGSRPNESTFWTKRRFAWSISSSSLDEGFRPLEVAGGERLERHPDHLLRPRAHLLEGGHEHSIGRDIRRKLDELAIVTQ